MSSLDKYTNSYTAPDLFQITGIRVASVAGLSAGSFDTHPYLLSTKQDVLPDSNTPPLSKPLRPSGFFTDFP